MAVAQREDREPKQTRAVIEGKDDAKISSTKLTKNMIICGPPERRPGTMHGGGESDACLKLSSQFDLDRPAEAR